MSATQWLERFRAWRQRGYEARCRAAHRAGHRCRECSIYVSATGQVSWTTRQLFLYCTYDIPERAGKRRDRGGKRIASVKS